MSAGSEKDDGEPRGELDRRQFLARGALIGGALVWAIPTIEAISLTSAHAASPSGPAGHGNGWGQPGPPPWAGHGGRSGDHG